MKAIIKKNYRAATDKEGFIYGFVRGALATLMVISMLSVFTGCVG